LPQIGPREVLYQDPFQTIYSATANFGHFEKTYYVRDTGKRAGVLVLRDSSVLLVRQYRFLINGLSWEVPGGKVDDGENPEEAAIREVREETGLLCQNLIPLASYLPGLDTNDNPTDVFYTDQFQTLSGAAQDDREVQEQAWVPLKSCNDMIINRQILDSLTIVAILSYQVLASNQFKTGR